MPDFARPPTTTFQPAYEGAGTSYSLGNPLLKALPPELVIANYLTGLTLNPTVTTGNLASLVQQKIDAAVGEFETRMGTFVVQRQIIAATNMSAPTVVDTINYNPETGGYSTGRPAVAGVDYDLLEPPYDYTLDRFRKWALVKLKHRPVSQVTSVTLALPPNFGILQVPWQWITVNNNSGIMRIVPVEGAMAVTSPGAGMWLPFFTMGSMRSVPQFTQIAYTAGVSPIPTDMVDAIAMLAASKVLEQYNAAYYPGVQSFSTDVDGVSQSVNMRQGGPFVYQIEQYRARAEDYMRAWRQAHNGVRMTSLGR